MTREEAINELKEDIALYTPRYGTIDELDRDLPDGRLVTALEMAIEALQEPEQRWIPCEVALPEKKGYYIVTLNNYCTDFCQWNGEGFGMYSGTKWYICDEVTAWMPLPEPYQAERREERRKSDVKST